MKALFALVAVAGVSVVPQSPLPEPTDPVLEALPFGFRDFKPGPYLAVAASLQADGKDKAIQTLAKWARDEKYGYKVFVLCRMLFTAKPKGEFRRAAVGVHFFFGGTGDDDWPLEPIELVEGIPFYLVVGGALGGKAEHPLMYLSYCTKNCDWSTEKYGPKTPEQIRKALDKLLVSPRWKEPLSKEDKEILSAQAK